MVSSPGGEFRGKTVKEATDAGLAQLGLTSNQVEIEVLSKGSRGVLGFGAEDARVRITPVTSSESSAKLSTEEAVQPEETAIAETVEKSMVVASEPAAVEQVEDQQPVESDPEAAEPDVAAISVGLLQGLLDHMDVHTNVRAVEYQGVLDAGQEPPLVLNIEGEDLGILIGRRGETLAAIQYITRLMVNHQVHRWTNLVVDVEGYKARREQQLVQLAERMADRAVESGRPVVLEAMPARERRIVHIALRNNPNVSTESVGEGDNRKVTIIPVE
ncbi:MAG: RNA-binding cell elongation regulator Jag/EloR [Chloroflexota bacterium]|nr:RNA-binding cell elongation regulator Jag/EloR [Chloroflexota bacterium]